MNGTRLKRFLDRAVSGEATNLIAEGVVVDGFIKGIGHLIVAGRVKGDCKIAGTVTLTETGSWRGQDRRRAGAGRGPARWQCEGR